MSATRLQEVLVCFGKGKQTDIATAQAAAVMWRMNKLNAALANPKLATEDDAEEYGKGHEFATTTFKTSWDVERHAGEVSQRGDGCVGDVLRPGQGGEVRVTTPNFTYTCTPLIPSAGDATELPYFSFVEQIRPGAAWSSTGRQSGCAVEGFTITIGSGPGRANSKITVEFAGSGKVIDSATGITMPAATVEKLLPSASLTLTINGVDYVTNKNIVSLETSWKNNIRMDDGFYPGLGLPDGGRRDHRRDPRQAGVWQPAGHPEVRRPLRRQLGRIREAQGADHRHGGHGARVRHQQLAPTHLAEGGLLHGGDRGDGPVRHGRGGLRAPVRRHQRHPHRGGQSRDVDAICQ